MPSQESTTSTTTTTQKPDDENTSTTTTTQEPETTTTTTTQKPAQGRKVGEKPSSDTHMLGDNEKPLEDQLEESQREAFANHEREQRENA